MNEICKNCGKERDTKISLGENIYWCQYCGAVNAGELGLFVPSGRVSVPVEFVEAVKELIGEYDLFPNSIETNQYKEKVQSMLTEIEKGGGG